MTKYLCLVAATTFMFAFEVSSAQTYDKVIKNCRIIDGSRKAAYDGDIGITGERITFIGKKRTYKAKEVIDGKRLVISPGFVDVHTHIEGNDMNVPTADNLIMDGVTSVVTGNCGSSHTDVKSYFRRLDSIKTSINIATLVGHNSVRDEVMGSSNRVPSSEELEKMKALVDQAMKDGAVGLSTGLGYVPGMYSKADEVVSLAKVIAPYGGIYTTHMRNEGDKVFESVNESLEIARQSGAALQISHLKISSKTAWGRAKELIEHIEAARKSGLDVAVDQYPYIASSTSLDSMLPAWALSGGRDSVLIRLSNTTLREKIKGEMLAGLERRRDKDYSFAIVANHRPDTTLNGKNLVEINALKGRQPLASDQIDTIFDLVVAAVRTQMVYFIMDERDVVEIMKYPLNMVASDGGIARFGVGAPHPRVYGTNARVLGKYVREDKVISLEEAIFRMTSLPAKRFHLKDRGLIKEGYFADLVMFDPSVVSDVSTFAKPHAYSEGVGSVMVNGEWVVREGKVMGVRSGKVMRRGA